METINTLCAWVAEMCFHDVCKGLYHFDWIGTPHQPLKSFKKNKHLTENISNEVITFSLLYLVWDGILLTELNIFSSYRY